VRQPVSRFYVPLFALVAAYLAFRLACFGAMGDIEGRGNTQPALTYFLTQPTVILRHLFSSLVPYHLAIDHSFLPADIGAAATALSFLVLGSGVLAGVLFFWRARTPVARYGLFAVFFYAIVLAPTS
jgi:hypothetical protein